MTLKQYINQRYITTKVKYCEYCQEELVKREYGWICLRCLEPVYNDED